MGGQESKQIDDMHKDFLNRFQQTFTHFQDSEDARLGLVQIFKNKYDKDAQAFIACKKTFILNDQQEQQIKKQITQVQDNKKRLNANQYLFKQVAFNIKKEETTQFCGSIKEIHTFYEYSQQTLEAEIEQRKKRDMQFDENELWIILYSLLKCSADLAQIESCLNDVRPTTIHFTKTGHVKIYSKLIVHEEISVIDKVINNKYCYLTPEQMKHLKYEMSNEGDDIPQTSQIEAHGTQSKQDGFQIGMSLLASAALFDPFVGSPPIYDFQNYSIDNNQINDILMRLQMQQRYSDCFIKVLQALLQPYDQLRPMPIKIYQILQDYESSIMSKEPFQYDLQEIQKYIKTNFDTSKSQQQIKLDPNGLQNARMNLQKSRYKQSQSYKIPQQNSMNNTSCVQNNNNFQYGNSYQISQKYNQQGTQGSPVLQSYEKYDNIQNQYIKQEQNSNTKQNSLSHITSNNITTNVSNVYSNQGQSVQSIQKNNNRQHLYQSQTIPIKNNKLLTKSQLTVYGNQNQNQTQNQTQNQNSYQNNQTYVTQTLQKQQSQQYTNHITHVSPKKEVREYADYEKYKQQQQYKEYNNNAKHLQQTQQSQIFQQRNPQQTQNVTTLTSSRFKQADYANNLSYQSQNNHQYVKQ